MGFSNLCSQCRNSNWVLYLQCYFVSVATVLGAGILGLPVTLSRTGLYPLLVHFIPATFFQVLSVVFFANVLQKAVSILRMKAIEEDDSTEQAHFGESTESAYSLLAFSPQPETDGEDNETHLISINANGKRQVTSPLPEVCLNLHLLGEVYFSRPFQYLFSANIVLFEVTFLISYSLAGGEALQSLMQLSSIIPAMSVLMWVLNGIIIVCMIYIVSILSILTLFKGSILIIAIIVVLLIGADIHHSTQTDFSYITDNLLMASVALNGVFCPLPMLYNHLPKAMNFDPTRTESDSGARGQVLGLVISVSMGLVTCMALNIFWSLGILSVVPQTCYGNGTDSCDSPNLFDAEAAGHISTVPLVQVIRMTYPEYLWLGNVVQTFILVSCIVSYLLYGSVLYQTMTGFVESIVSEDSRIFSIHCLPSRRILSVSITLVIFSVIYICAVTNPGGFVTVLEKLGSFSYGTLICFFAYTMVWSSMYKPKYREVPAPLSYEGWIRHAQWGIPLYFGFLCIYDLYDTIVEFS